LWFFSRFVTKGGLGEGGKSQVEVGESGSWSIHRESNGCQQRFPEHLAQGQEKVKYHHVLYENIG